MSGNNDSTLKSYIDSAVGTAQSALGSLTGNTGDKVQGDARQSKASAEHAASHEVGKVGPVSISSSGGVATDHPDRAEGSWNQTIGSGKEMLGNLVGADGLKQEGIRQNQQGKGQEAEGQVSDYGHGVADRVKGRLGEAATGFTGDRDRQGHYQALHDEGKTRQRSAESDIQKQSDY